MWTWLFGPKVINSAGSYGTKGIPHINNLPPSRSGATGIVNNENMFLLFGGDVGGIIVF